jgi:hypothetical protein
MQFLCAYYRKKLNFSSVALSRSNYDELRGIAVDQGNAPDAPADADGGVEMQTYEASAAAVNEFQEVAPAAPRRSSQASSSLENASLPQAEEDVAIIGQEESFVEMQAQEPTAAAGHRGGAAGQRGCARQLGCPWRTHLPDRHLLLGRRIISVIATLLLIALFLSGVDLAFSSLASAAFLATVQALVCGVDPMPTMMSLDYGLLILFAGLFSVVGALNATGIPAQVLQSLFTSLPLDTSAGVAGFTAVMIVVSVLFFFSFLPDLNLYTFQSYHHPTDEQRNQQRSRGDLTSAFHQLS